MNNLVFISERPHCPMRHENGNCLVLYGFCTANTKADCEAAHRAYDLGCASALEKVKLANDCIKSNH